MKAELTTIKIGFFILWLIAILVNFTGCESYNSSIETYDDTRIDVYVAHTNFRNDLVYDEDTSIVYIYNHNSYGSSYTPYYSKNGKLCKYEDGRIVELK